MTTPGTSDPVDAPGDLTGDVCGLPDGGTVPIGARPIPREGAPADAPPRVVATVPAVELLAELIAADGPVMFHQSGGCCDGSAPMCYPDGEFRVGMRDVLVGRLDLGGDGVVPVWISGTQFEAWKHTQLVIDAVPGRGSGFSLEGPTGRRFLARGRTFGAAELAALEKVPALRGMDLDDP